MLVLQPKQVCQYISNCPWIRGRFVTSGRFPCEGMNPERANVFTCDFVDNQGCFIEGSGYQRNPKDITGRMKVLLE